MNLLHSLQNHRQFDRRALTAMACLALFAGTPQLARVAAEKPGEVRINFVEEKTGSPVSCRVELRAPNGKPIPIRGELQRGSWTLVDGEFTYRGKPGEYRLKVFHGPQFSSGEGGFILDNGGEGADVISLPRHANIQDEGWYGGDLLTFAPAQETDRWLPAEDLDMAARVRRGSMPSKTIVTGTGSSDSASASGSDSEQTVAPPKKALPSTSGPRWVEDEAYLDDRQGSGITFHFWQPPAAVPEWVPSSKLLGMAKAQPKTHAEIQKLWARDVPLWLASGRIDSIQVLSDHLTLDGKGGARTSEMFHSEPERFAGPRGPGRLVEHIYWQVLECGLRIAPSAGSGFARSTSPMGYSRVYVNCGPAVSSAAWWQALRDGRSFVTSGPLLRSNVNGQLPGHLFEIPSGDSLALAIGLTLTVSDPVEYLDVIFNGETLYQARLDEYAKQGGRIPTQKISQSGWMVIRVVTEREHTYRIASTAPYYFEVGQQPRISRSAIAFFQQWLEDSAKKITAGESKSASAADPYIRSARDFWRKRLEQSNAP